MKRFDRRHLALIPTVLSVIILACYVLFVVRHTHSDQLYDLRTGWTLEYNDERYEDVRINDLPELISDGLVHDEQFMLWRTLDEEVDASPALELSINHFALELSLDGEYIGECGMRAYQNGEFVGGNRYYISVPADYRGKTLSLTFYTEDDGTVPLIAFIRFSSFGELWRHAIHENGYVIVIGIFLCIFGSFFLLFSLFFNVLLPEIKGQLVSSFISIILGVWILTHFRCFAPMGWGRHTATVEYVAFYLALPLLYLLVSQVCRTGWLYRILGIITTVLTGAAFVLHFAGIVHLHHWRVFYYVLCTLFLVILFILDIRGIRQKRADAMSVMQMAGPTIFCLFIFIGMLVYLNAGGNYVSGQHASKFIMTTGPLIFAITRFLIYLWLLMEMTPRKLELASLDRLAYTDALTGLSSRALLGEAAMMSSSPSGRTLGKSALRGRWQRWWCALPRWRIQRRISRTASPTATPITVNFRTRIRTACICRRISACTRASMRCADDGQGIRQVES